MGDTKSILSGFSDRLHRAFTRWWGGIGCRVSFFMSTALLLVALLVGAFFFWQGKQALDVEIRGRALYVARDLAALTLDDIITGNRLEIYKKLTPPFSMNEETSSGSDLL